MSKAAALFPGQGSQSVGMGRDVVETSSAARRVFERASAVLGVDLAAICFDGPAATLEATDVQQPAIFVTSVAIWAALAERTPGAVAFESMAGLSLGEYTALHLAGAIGFEDALRVVRTRGQLMQRAAESTPSGMVSVIGLDGDAVEELCAEAAQGAVLVPANFNCPGQVVVSGVTAACERLVPLAESRGGRAVALKVAGAFHSPLMQSAAEGLATALADVSIRPPAVPVVSNVTARPHDRPEAIRAALVQQLVKPVQWQAGVEYLIGLGFERFVEIGPGRVLTGLMRKINRKVAAVNVSSQAGISRGIDGSSSERE
jgi:[acyl-carrier-protein] S-malonyltransferase